MVNIAISNIYRHYYIQNCMYSSITASSFTISDQNIRELLEQVPFDFVDKQTYEQPFCHSTHKNLSWKVAPLAPQQLLLSFPSLYNVKYLVIKKFTHGAEMTIQIAQHEKGPFVQVYKDKFICKGKTVKDQQKQIDLGALPCRAIRLKITKGVHINSNNIKIVGILSQKIQQKLGMDYFKLLVVNPQKIIFS